MKEKKLLITDTTFRDAHQSLIATRMRTNDMLGITDLYEELFKNLFSVECWGGATFDVALRFLNEDPWSRLEKLRESMPSALLQMLFRGSNALGYTNYPDNVLRRFIQISAQSGIDVFRIFDALNWIENMKVSIDEVLKTEKINAMAHITGGGLTENIPRVIPKQYKALISKNSWKTSKLFDWIKSEANLDDDELFKTFNCGIGMVIIVEKESKNRVMTSLRDSKENVFEIGKITKKNGNETQIQIL